MSKHKSAIQIGEQRIEFHEPNMVLAYAALAPLVSEALAFYEAGDSERGFRALHEARKVVHMATAMTGVIPIVPPPTTDIQKACA